MSIFVSAFSWAQYLVALYQNMALGLSGIVALCLLTQWVGCGAVDNSQSMSSDTVSSLFPDRPIRPLPKRRLRERLSPEVAQSIKYPPTTYDTVSLFYYPPFTLKKEGAAAAGSEPANAVEPSRRSELGSAPAFLRNGLGHGVEEEEGSRVRGALFARSPPEILSRAARNPFRPDQPRPADPQLPPSAASSVDGYDSFENTNNKKKRKIPSAGDSAINTAHSLNNEISSLAISAGAHSPVNDAVGDRPLHGSTGYPASGSYVPNNPGFSGPGRGRLGRSRNGRSPLRALSDSNNGWPARLSKTGPSPWSTVPENSGIISNAIANAERMASQGHEKVSLLQQHSAAVKNTPASTQFTFTCDSHVPGTVQWPGHPSKYNMGSQQSSCNSANNDSSKAGGADARQSRTKSRRHLERELKAAARQRRRKASDLKHSLKAEDVWICEFCEYERIFGVAPRALIRDYEIKDRRLRQEEADRKRLLEKAKAKSRKGRKAARSGNRAGQGASHTTDQVPGEATDEPDAPDMHHNPSHSTQSEEDECEDDEVEEEKPQHVEQRVEQGVEQRGHVVLHIGDSRGRFTSQRTGA
ncbi:hypothetical protein L249_2900 [Ophiocordyceps polyrhachis-furcata BCC 54312]|uniref:Uncharacterized protein n=1 Tax=Ophiocordyceps polyrhachis-furcata BCC 54312 TaxID=1330021 RepID=A0A367LQI8_9HYPO|nr:hypothetical protein L249_2900 [Ophiocordyceps polyrhachis-furcata BCC 54312]